MSFSDWLSLLLVTNLRFFILLFSLLQNKRRSQKYKIYDNILIQKKSGNEEHVFF